MPETRISAQNSPSTVDKSQRADGDDDRQPDALQQDRQELDGVAEKLLHRLRSRVASR